MVTRYSKLWRAAILLAAACGFASGSAFAGGPIFGVMSGGGSTSMAGSGISARAAYISSGGSVYTGYGSGLYSPFFFPSYGGVFFSDEASNFFQNSDQLGRHWWTGPNGSTNPRQEGYNPSAGYNWQMIGTLLLSAYPAKAKVVLDGSDIGMADQLGPIQLPLGEHTLKLEMPGFRPSETVIHVFQPMIRNLKIHLVSSRS